MILVWCWHDIDVVLVWCWWGGACSCCFGRHTEWHWHCSWYSLSHQFRSKPNMDAVLPHLPARSQSLWCTTFGNHIDNFSWIPAFHIWLMCKHSLPSQQFREWFSVVVVVLPSFILCISQCSRDFLWKLYFMCQSCLVLHFLAANGSANNWEM